MNLIQFKKNLNDIIIGIANGDNWIYIFGCTAWVYDLRIRIRNTTRW